MMVVAAPLLFLGLLEGVLWLGGYGYSPSFFVPVRGTDLLATNPRFGWRFFPKAIARTPLPLVMRREKSPGRPRVFVLGESAAMGVPEPLFGFARYLDPDWEVVNTAMTAVNSIVVREIAEECARYQPDAFIVYMGNNEVVGPQSAAGAWLKRWRVGQWLDSVITRPGTRTWLGMEAFLGRRMKADDVRLSGIYSRFESNLRAICRTGYRAGARVMLSTIAVNLRDQPPFAGVEARRAYESGDFAQARDLDELRFRADSRINAIIRQVAPSEPGVELVDFERAVEPSARYFWEHVHLRPEGNKLLASYFSKRVANRFVTEWDALRMERDIWAMTRRPPFQPSATPLPSRPVDLDAAAEYYRLAVLQAPEDLLLRERYAELLYERGHWREASEQWRQMIVRLPGIKHWHTGFAESSLAAGETTAARAEYEGALRIDPDFVAALIGMGVVSAEQEAEMWLARALRLDPDSAEPHNNLGALRLRQGRMHEAVELFEKAVTLKPGFGTASLNLGGTLARLDRVDEAIPHYQAALAERPSLVAAHYDLGVLLARNQRYQEAITEYQAALRLDPRHADAENNWGTALARQGRMREAIVHFERALRLNPSHAEARRNLAKARGGG
jgi:tetratricopeptide (TPR) repeat protein